MVGFPDPAWIVQPSLHVNDVNVCISVYLHKFGVHREHRARVKGGISYYPCGCGYRLTWKMQILICGFLLFLLYHSSRFSLARFVSFISFW